MTIALWCILVAGLLPFVWSTLSKSGSRYDNARPRLQEKTGWRQRADWAQQNAWEAFAPFAAAVLVAHWTHAPQGTVDLLAGLFIACRIGHGLAYLGDRPTLRSLIWTGGLLCVIGLYVSAARAA
ncbi:MAG TPA: MAPEG family protein [Rhodocyclaceae bacterium]|nr:MAPEG family protein [Rhodocyclaceae bacterium]